MDFIGLLAKLTDKFGVSARTKGETWKGKKGNFQLLKHAIKNKGRLEMPATWAKNICAPELLQVMQNEVAQRNPVAPERWTISLETPTERFQKLGYYHLQPLREK